MKRILPVASIVIVISLVVSVNIVVSKLSIKEKQKTHWVEKEQR
jgi:hypothetical protein